MPTVDIDRLLDKSIIDFYVYKDKETQVSGIQILTPSSTIVSDSSKQIEAFTRLFEMNKKESANFFIDYKKEKMQSKKEETISLAGNLINAVEVLKNSKVISKNLYDSIYKNSEIVTILNNSKDFQIEYSTEEIQRTAAIVFEQAASEMKVNSPENNKIANDDLLLENVMQKFPSLNTKEQESFLSKFANTLKSHGYEVSINQVHSSNQPKSPKVY